MKEQGFQANEDIFEIAKEYDGREIAVIKPNVQYQVALAGMLKKEKPEFSEINELLKRAPTHTGIWIEESSRDKFLELLTNISNTNYEINEEGFLVQKDTVLNTNNYDKTIKKMLSDEKLHIFNISSMTYLVDEATGEITEYPFEEMDPYTEYEYFEAEDKEMFIVTSNSSGKVEQQQIFENIFEN